MQCRSGACFCRPGVTGFSCDKCKPLHFGFSHSGCRNFHILRELTINETIFSQGRTERVERGGRILWCKKISSLPNPEKNVIREGVWGWGGHPSLCKPLVNILRILSRPDIVEKRREDQNKVQLSKTAVTLDNWNMSFSPQKLVAITKNNLLVYLYAEKYLSNVGRREIV